MEWVVLLWFKYILKCTFSDRALPNPSLFLRSGQRAGPGGNRGPEQKDPMSYVVDAPSSTAAPEKSAHTEPTTTAADDTASGTPADLIIRDIFDVLPAIPAHAMRAVGIRAIGSRAKIRAGRYVFVNTVTGALWALQNWCIMYGLGMHPIGSAVLVFLALVPVTFLSSAAEVQIFSSQFLSRHLAEGDDIFAEFQAETRWWYVRGLGGLMWEALVWGVPFALLCWPVLQPDATTDTPLAVRAALWSGLVATPAFHMFWMPLQTWAPLTKLQQKISTLRTRQFVRRLLALLSDEQLSAAEAADKLGALHAQSALHVHRELKIWGDQALALGIMAPGGIAAAMWLLLGTVHDHQVHNADAAGWLRPLAAAAWLAMSIPWAGQFLVTATGPNNIWQDFLKDVLMDAKVMRHALLKFDGSAPALFKWLERNKICLWLGPMPIDRELLGKIAAVLGSLTTAAALLFARLAGYY